MSGKYSVLKKVTLSISGAFGVTMLTKREVLRAIQSDISTTNGLSLYVQDAEVTVTLESGETKVLESELRVLSPFESLPTSMQNCIAQNKIRHYDPDMDTLRESDLCQLRALSKDECFDAWCEWNGLLNYGNKLREVYREIYARTGVI